MTRDEFEQQQAVELYQEKAARAGALWDDALRELSGTTHKWKWEYMDYLEAIKYQDKTDVTLEMAKEEIMSYEEFAKLKETEGKVQEQAYETVGDTKIAAIQTDSIDESQTTVASMDIVVETLEIEEKASEDAEVVPEVIDYTKLSMKERASLLRVPTDDYTAEYDAYCQRMGYTAEKMKSIRYKMAVYDEFLEEYNHRKRLVGVKNDVYREHSRGSR